MESTTKGSLKDPKTTPFSNEDLPSSRPGKKTFVVIAAAGLGITALVYSQQIKMLLGIE